SSACNATAACATASPPSNAFAKKSTSAAPANDVARPDAGSSSFDPPAVTFGGTVSVAVFAICRGGRRSGENGFRFGPPPQPRNPFSPDFPLLRSWLTALLHDVGHGPFSHAVEDPSLWCGRELAQIAAVFRLIGAVSRVATAR